MRILGYLALGYVALVLVGSLTTVGPTGLLLLLVLVVVGAVAWLSRRGAPGRLRHVPALPDPVAGRTERAGLRPRVDTLLRELPENPADSHLLLDVVSLHEHEPAEERARLEERYREERGRLTAAARALESGASAEQLAGDVARVESYVDGLRRTVDEATADPVASALEATGRASDALAAARDALGGVDDEERAELEARLDDAAGKLRTAELAFTKDAERPLLALRLAGEVQRISAEVSERARKLQALPGLVGRRLAELERATERAERELMQVKEEFAAVSREYAPACWSEIRGVGAAADQAARHARRHAAAAAARPPGEAAEASEEIDAAFRALERTDELTKRIASHLRRLEDASMTARERVASAERAVETAPSASGDDEERLARAARLVAQAREELGKRRPDWLRVVELADRAGELATLPAEAAVGAVPAAGIDVLREELAAERARAKETRDEAWAHGLVSVERDATVRPLLDDLEAAYQRAIGRDATVAEGDEAGERQRIEAAIEAYRAFGRRAGSVRSEIAGAYERSLANRRRSAIPADDEATVLVWGAATVAAAFLRER